MEQRSPGDGGAAANRLPIPISAFPSALEQGTLPPEQLLAWLQAYVERDAAVWETHWEPRSVYQDGVLSHVNRTAQALGARPGMSTRAFVALALGRPPEG